MNKPKVYLKDPISPKVYDRLIEKVEIVDNFDHPELLDAIIIRQASCPRDVIEKAKNLKIISMHGTGTDTIDMSAAKEYNIPVVVHSGYNSRSVAELAVSYCLALSRKLKEINNSLTKGKYHKFGDPYSNEHEVFGKTIGLIGTGAVSKEIYKIMKGGFNTKALAYNPHKTKEEMLEMGYEQVATLKELFQKSDIVFVCVTLNKETENMLNYHIFKHAKENLILANISRGTIINEDDLYKALVEGKIKGAASDVFKKEPIQKDSPLLKLDNFIATYHIGGSTVEAMERLGNAVVDDVFHALGI